MAVVGPESFLVTKQGHLLPDELDRARAWGQGLVRSFKHQGRVGQEYSPTMELMASLEGGEAGIIDEAVTALDRSHLAHYERAGKDEDRLRLKTLFDAVLDGINERQLASIQQYGEKLARDRYHAGFDIAEVQTAFNVLEEAMWRRIVAVTPPDQLAEAIGLLSTVLGAGKDALARTYVALAAKQHVASLDLGALFEGT